MTEDAQPVGRRAVGRPVDPDIEARVFAVVREVYSETGWAGFTIHAVATRAKVGKAAIYRRWGSKEELIADAIVSTVSAPIQDRGSLREDLIAVVQGELAEYLRPADGLVRLRAMVEAKAYPELFGAAMDRIRRLRTANGRTIVDTARRRGELPTEADGILMLDAIGGMTMNRFLATPSYAMRELQRDSRQFAESVVDYVLAATDAHLRHRT
ncbi:TetR/AcrR family transcriptional regulator [Pseudonocardia ailaonensis]|uniref:TetR/AcrR family transcriptional regulator n=1 Tax=Pseudonocardia ailaonensis TaxID=367279 RepID=A0ABN2MHN0_9PSEU